MNTRFATGFIVCVFAFASCAYGDIIFGTGGSAASNNVGSYVQTDTNKATGQFLGEVDDILKVVTDVPLTVPAAGAARIEQDGTPFTTVVYTPLVFAWEIFELNPIYAGTDGTFVLKVIDDGGTEWVSGAFPLVNGSNRVWAQAINGQSIVKLTVEASGALINDIRQVRITQSDLAIPEPGSMAILGIASVFGLGWVTRKKALKAKMAV